MTTIRTKYVGPTQHTRILTRGDQIQIGVSEANLQDNLRWDLLRGHRLTIENVDPSLRDYLEASTTFEITEVIEEPSVVNPDQDELDLNQTIVDLDQYAKSDDEV